MQHESFMHTREHNVCFTESIEEVAADHPAAMQLQTVNRTLCADQLADSVLLQVYEDPDLIRLLAAVMNKPSLYPMADPLASVNVMSYRSGEALNWHFDRSEFTTTLLLQAPIEGGSFEYRRGLKDGPYHDWDGIGQLLLGRDQRVQTLELTAGTLNVFKGVETAHRTTPVAGLRDRVISVFSYYETPDVVFTPDEQLGFYGRTAL